MDIEDVQASGADYIFMHSSNIKVKGLRLNGNYSDEISQSEDH